VAAGDNVVEPRLCPLDAMAVDVGSVRRIQIHDLVAGGSDAQFGVARGDFGPVDCQIVGDGPADG
jgi:hypothetical protein